METRLVEAVPVETATTKRALTPMVVVTDLAREEIAYILTAPSDSASMVAAPVETAGTEDV